MRTNFISKGLNERKLMNIVIAVIYRKPKSTRTSQNQLLRGCPQVHFEGEPKPEIFEKKTTSNSRQYMSVIRYTRTNKHAESYREQK